MGPVLRKWKRSLGKWLSWKIAFHVTMRSWVQILRVYVKSQPLLNLVLGDALVLRLQRVESCWVGSGNKPGSSGIAASAALTAESSLHPYFISFWPLQLNLKFAWNWFFGEGGIWVEIKLNSLQIFKLWCPS